MKKYLEIAAGVMATVAVVSPALADVACSGTNAAASSAIPVATSDGFHVQGFTARCSANVYLDFTQNATVMAVGSSSLKGRNTFGGHTNGGGVSSMGACTGTGGACGSADSARGATDAFANATSSG